MFLRPITFLTRTLGLVAVAVFAALLVWDLDPSRLLLLARDLGTTLPWETWAQTLAMPESWQPWFPWLAAVAALLLAHILVALRPSALPATLLGILLLYGVRAAGDVGQVWSDSEERLLLLGCLAAWTIFVALRWGFPYVLAALLAGLGGMLLFAPVPDSQRLALQLLPAVLAPWLARRSLCASLPKAQGA